MGRAISILIGLGLLLGGTLSLATPTQIFGRSDTRLVHLNSTTPRGGTAVSTLSGLSAVNRSAKLALAAYSLGEDDVFVFLPLILNSAVTTQAPTATATTTFTLTPVTTMTATSTATVAPSGTAAATTTSTTPATTPTPAVTPTLITDRCKIENGRFELGEPGEAPPWVQEGVNAERGGLITDVRSIIGSPPSGRRAVYFGGLAVHRDVNQDILYQAVAIPAGAAATTLSYWLYIAEDFPPPTTLSVELRDPDRQLLQAIHTVDLNRREEVWLSFSHEIDLSAFAGQTVLLYFDFQTQQANAMFMDDVGFDTCAP